MKTIYRNIPEEEKAKIRMISAEERGAMLYLCWYSEQTAVSKREKIKQMLKAGQCKTTRQY